MLICALSLSGCGLMPNLIPDIQTEKIRISASPKVNQGFPVAVDIVLLNENLLVEVVKDLSGKEWFKKRDQFAIDHPKLAHVIRREVVEGENLPVVKLKYSQRTKAKGVFVFANFLADGTHRLRIDTIKEPKIVLKDNLMRLVTK